ncbi:MAG: hypothetical protein V3U56_01470 [Syntrophobacteria bacterium]
MLVPFINAVLACRFDVLLEVQWRKEWDTAPRGEPATGLMTDWLKKGELKGLNPPPKEQK